MLVAVGSPELLPILSRTLREGGIAVAPCDTMYGIIGEVPEAEGRIRNVKGRGEERPFLQLLADISWVTRVSDFAVPPALARYWPGPLTVVIPLRGGGDAAFRVPDSPLLKDLISRLGKPIFSTSVNKSGRPPLSTIDEIRREFEAEVDLIVDAGDLPAGSPSTVVDATVRPYRVIRQGSLEIPLQYLQ